MPLESPLVLLQEWFSAWKELGVLPEEIPNNLIDRTSTFILMNKYNNFVVDEDTDIFDQLRSKHHIPYEDENHRGGNCADLIVELVVQRYKIERKVIDRKRITDRFSIQAQEFLQWLVDMDDPLNKLAAAERRKVSLNSIISKAEKILAILNVHEENIDPDG